MCVIKYCLKTLYNKAERKVKLIKQKLVHKVADRTNHGNLF